MNKDVEDFQMKEINKFLLPIPRLKEKYKKYWQYSILNELKFEYMTIIY